MSDYIARSIYDQRSFFEEMACTLHGIDRRRKVNGGRSYKCQCPNCGKNESVFFASKKGDTFLFKCFRENNCGIGCITLHQLIMRYGSESIRNRWLRKDEGKWLPIKNRIPRKSSTKMTFRESMQLKSNLSFLMAIREMDIQKHQPHTPITHPPTQSHEG